MHSLTPHDAWKEVTGQAVNPNLIGEAKYRELVADHVMFKVSGLLTKGQAMRQGGRRVVPGPPCSVCGATTCACLVLLRHCLRAAPSLFFCPSCLERTWARTRFCRRRASVAIGPAAGAATSPMTAASSSGSGRRTSSASCAWPKVRRSEASKPQRSGLLMTCALELDLTKRPSPFYGCLRHLFCCCCIVCTSIQRLRAEHRVRPIIIPPRLTAVTPGFVLNTVFERLEKALAVLESIPGVTFATSTKSECLPFSFQDADAEK